MQIGIGAGSWRNQVNRYFQHRLIRKHTQRFGPALGCAGPFCSSAHLQIISRRRRTLRLEKDQRRTTALPSLAAIQLPRQAPDLHTDPHPSPLFSPSPWKKACYFKKDPFDPSKQRTYAPAYAVARCCSWCPSRTLTTLETPGSCMVTP
jgi:hypothetical protein